MKSINFNRLKFELNLKFKALKIALILMIWIIINETRYPAVFLAQDHGKIRRLLS